MKFKRYSELILGVLILLLGIFYYFLTSNLPSKEIIDSRFIPYILSGFLFVLSIIQINRGIKFIKYEIEDEEKVTGDYLTFIKSLVAIILYIGMLNILGFIIATIIFLFFQFTILTPNRLKSNYLLYVIVSIVTSLTVYYLFRYGLNLVLPRGIFNIGGIDPYGSFIICYS